MAVDTKGVIFEWSKADMYNLLETCKTHGIRPLIDNYIPEGGTVLESGCGAGQWVRYLQDRGYRPTGLELLGETVEMVNKVWPDLDVVQGDAEASPFEDGSFDAVLSLGIIEHWTAGPDAPLWDIYRVLKPGGIAIITIPLQNRVRRIKRKLLWKEIFGIPRALAVKAIKGEKRPLNRLRAGYKYPVYPTYGEFFEYRMNEEQFANEVRRAGFEILEHIPISEIDGVHHELNPLGLLTSYRNRQFETTPLADRLNELLSKKRFFHPHMQAIVARKPL